MYKIAINELNSFVNQEKLWQSEQGGRTIFILSPDEANCK